MDTPAFDPADAAKIDEVVKNELKVSSSASVMLIGCGGCGINLARPFLDEKVLDSVRFFDTSSANILHGESVYVVANGSGSGGDRRTNSDDIAREIPKISDEHLGTADVAIVIFSLGGGSGSILGPILVREYNRRGLRVIAVVVADTSYSVAATNTLNTLKTLTAIAQNNDIYLPLMALTNDGSDKRSAVDRAAKEMIASAIHILVTPVYEVDRNDRLNWINPMRVAGSNPGIKLMNFQVSNVTFDRNIILGGQSAEMVDSLLVLKSSEEEGALSEPFSRLKKVGFFHRNAKWIQGYVSSDISPVEKIIDRVEKTKHQERGNVHKSLDRLNTSGSGDLIL